MSAKDCNKSIYVYFQDRILHKNTTKMSNIYNENKDFDGMLYCKYTTENYLGWKLNKYNSIIS